MAVFNLNINGKQHEVDVDPSTPMLWVLRDHLDLVGTKFGCGIAQCGACTILVNGVATRSCITFVDSVATRKSQQSKDFGKRGSSAPKSLDRRRCATMWLLPKRTNYERCRIIKCESIAQRRRN